MFKNILFAAFAGFFCLAVNGQIGISSEDRLDAEANIYQKIADVSLQTNIEQVQLSQLYRQSPLIIAQVFTRCSGICTPYIIQLKESLQQLQSDKPYKVLVFSFDPQDKEENMADLAKRYQLESDTNWIFAATAQIEELTSSIGFTSAWDEARMQFDHEALLTGVNKEGIIKKKLVGMQNKQQLLSMVNEINNGFQPSFPLPNKNSFLSCFTYNEETGKSKPSIGLLVMLMPGVLTFLMVVTLAMVKKR